MSHTWPSSGTSYKILDGNDYYWPITKYSYVVVVVVVVVVVIVVSSSSSNIVGSVSAAAAAAAAHFSPSGWTDKLIADYNRCIMLAFKTHASSHQ